MPAYRYVSGVGYVRTGSADLGVDLAQPKPIPNPTSTPDQLDALGVAPDDADVPSGTGREVEAWIMAPASPAERAERAERALEHEAARSGGARAGVKATATKAIDSHVPVDPTPAEPEQEPEPGDDQDDDPAQLDV